MPNSGIQALSERAHPVHGHGYGADSNKEVGTLKRVPCAVHGGVLIIQCTLFTPRCQVRPALNGTASVRWTLSIRSGQECQHRVVAVARPRSTSFPLGVRSPSQTKQVQNINNTQVFSHARHEHNKIYIQIILARRWKPKLLNTLRREPHTLARTRTDLHSRRQCEAMEMEIIHGK